MRQKLGILIGLLLLVVVLVALNAATYVQREKAPDTESMPNRSTFNPGATGTQAFYSLLAETGRKVTRWQRPIDELIAERRNRPSTFVVIGRTRRGFDDTEVKQLVEWVRNGGRLVMIDREPPEEFLKAIHDWEIEFQRREAQLVFGSDPTDQKEMTGGLPAVRPVQPSVLIAGVNAVQPSRFASNIAVARRIPEPGEAASASGYRLSLQTAPPPFRATPTPADPHLRDETVTGDSYDDFSSNAPVTHLANAQRNVLVDVRHGLGSIVFLSDPYIVSNAGVALVDNAQLGVNIVTAGGGLTAFDEYHQGYGSNRNAVLQYFAGTPVVALFAQAVLIAAFVFFSKSRRFARPVPEPEPDRLAKLEYVAAMAELQQRTRAYDLAIENIYGDFRRRVSHLFGVDARLVGRKALAEMIAERIGEDPKTVYDLMKRCEDIAHGDAASRNETVTLAGRLREIESSLGLDRAASRRSLR